VKAKKRNGGKSHHFMSSTQRENETEVSLSSCLCSRTRNEAHQKVEEMVLAVANKGGTKKTISYMQSYRTGKKPRQMNQYSLRFVCIVCVPAASGPMSQRYRATAAARQ
jgi:phage FluMu gp28-like protein